MGSIGSDTNGLYLLYGYPIRPVEGEHGNDFWMLLTGDMAASKKDMDIMDDHTDLEKGSWVVHAQHGLGQVTGVDVKEISGVKNKFYVVKTDQITYWLPVDDQENLRIRPMASIQSFQNALELISSEPEKLDDNFRRRLFYIKEQITEGSLQGKARLIRDIHARDLQKDIHINEKKILENLISQFLREWVEATGIEIKSARLQLHEALVKSSAHLKPKKSVF